MFILRNSLEELNPATLQDETELFEPAFSENYDEVAVDELLNHFPLVGLKLLNSREMCSLSCM